MTARELFDRTLPEGLAGRRTDGVLRVVSAYLEAVGLAVESEPNAPPFDAETADKWVELLVSLAERRKCGGLAETP
jgi:hypothetical protein